MSQEIRYGVFAVVCVSALTAAFYAGIQYDRSSRPVALQTAAAPVVSATPTHAADASAKIIERAETALKMKLTDPYSAHFSGETIARTNTFGTTVCGLVNSKTPYGGYGGQTLFVAWTDIDPPLVVMNITSQPPGLPRAGAIGAFLGATDDSGCGDKSRHESYDGQIEGLMKVCMAKKAKSLPDATFTNRQVCLIDTEYKIEQMMGMTR